jgi:hypothetical protein
VIGKLKLDPAEVRVVRTDELGMTVQLADGVTVRLLSDGTVRLKTSKYRMVLDWFTTKPDEGGVSIAGLSLTPKRVTR